MKPNFKDYGHLNRMVIDRPVSYEIIRDTFLFVIEKSRFANSESESDMISEISIFIVSAIRSLRFARWKRKHVYLLIHDILTNYLQDFDDFDNTFLDIESGLVGNCSLDSIDRFPNEPEDIDELGLFVRDYKWLDDNSPNVS